MLNADTKRNIDAARDVLVGKVPDPKAQVDQITTALIYKFMADLDQGSTDLGGKATFFSGDYQKFAWQNLIDTRLSGEARLDLYTQAISSLQNNPNLPQLFRDIFKNAFLPYRDPQTLHLFLKEINKFTYSHSEELGNAFEYLLSILGSQGDAGQFRTPRHIIDFLVQVVDPQKHETILDPACGTAGFLISSYKHILNANTSPNAANVGDQLNPAQRQTLTQNIHGYDISPDMVKLSLVNLYLHGFASPNIHEYDTLTSEKNWDTSFDVILANPPFMTPKGGIRPHKRFQIQANRSEVLFVDYILEHLSPNGRAAVIVPEGIIFKSENAYKQLRKLLVQDGLIAVISLPAGVFNPYSGVKTSVLIFNALHAKTTDQVLFIKINNDGFDLGAQRRPITQNDLPHALELIKAWVNGASIDDPIALTVPKTTLAEGGDYNLTADRYRDNHSILKIRYPLVRLGDILDYEQPTKFIVNTVNYSEEYKIPVLTAGKSFILGHTNESFGIMDIGLPVIIFDDFTTDIKFVDFPFKIKSSAMKILRAKNGISDIRYVYYVMRNISFDAGIHKRYWISEYSNITIPLPPLDIQKQIVATIQEKQNAINAAKTIIQTIHNQRKTFGAHLLTDPTIPSTTLGEVCSFKRGPFGGSLKKDIFVDHGFKVYEQKNAIQDNFSIGSYFVTLEKYKEMKAFELNPGDLIISCSGTMGKIAIAPENIEPGIINQALLRLTPDLEITTSKYVKFILESDHIQSKYFRDTSGAAIQNVASVKVLKEISIPFPSLEIQKQLVDHANTLEAIAAANQNLITLMQQEIVNILNDI